MNVVKISAEYTESVGDDGWPVRTTTGWINMTCTCGTYVRGLRDEVLPLIQSHCDRELLPTSEIIK